MAQPLPVSRRDQKRARVWLAGVIGGTDWQQDVRVRDLSEGGALLSCEMPPPLDAEISLFCGTMEIHARVAWVGNNFVGLAFSSPIDPRDLMGQMESVLRVSAPRSYSGYNLDAD